MQNYKSLRVKAVIWATLVDTHRETAVDRIYY